MAEKRSSVQLGTAFERRVKALIEEELEQGDLGIHPQNAVVFHQRGYHSLQRGSDIVVDLAIEVSMTGAPQPSLVWVWECKSSKRPIKVDEIEEFHAKLQQIGANRTKGTIVSESKYERGAIRFAKATGIGLVRVTPESKFEHVAYCRTPPTKEELAREVEAGLTAGMRAEVGSSFYGLRPDGGYDDDFWSYLDASLR